MTVRRGGRQPDASAHFASRLRGGLRLYGPAHLAILLAPMALLLGAGLGLPMARAIHGSLFGTDVVGSSYQALLQDSAFWTILGRTLQTAAAVAGLCFIIALPTAEFLTRVRPALRPMVLALVIVPLWSSVIARTYSWIGVFQRDGLVDSVAALLGLGPLQLLYTQTAVIVGMVHVLLPLVLLPAYAALQRYDERISFASRSLGGGPVRTYLRVKLPLIAPQVLAATLGVFVLSLGFFVTPAILGGRRSQLVSNFISQQIFDRFDLPRAQAMSLVLLAATFVVLAGIALVRSILRKRFT